MEKLPGVESAKVSLNEGRTTIQLNPGNAVSLTQIRQGVERNGFTPQQAVVNAHADVVATGDRLQLKISGTNDTYDVAATAHVENIQQQLKNNAGQRVVIEGIVPAQKDPNATPMIQVNSVKTLTRQ